MKITYEFNDDDADSRLHFENGYNYYTALLEIEEAWRKLKKEIISQEVAIERIRQSLEKANIFD